MEGRMKRLKTWQGVVIAAILVLPWATSLWADPQKVLSTIDGNSAGCRVVSQKIFEFKELGQQEFKSSQLLMEELRKLGYKVTGDLKVPADLVKEGIAKTVFRTRQLGSHLHMSLFFGNKNWGRVPVYVGVDEAISNPNNMNLKFKIKGLLLSDLKDLQFNPFLIYTKNCATHFFVNHLCGGKN